jgi:hypothetical protein
MNAHAPCDDGSCGLCPRCLAGDEGVFVPVDGKRGPKPAPRLPPRPEPPEGGFESLEDEHKADMARDAWDFLAAEAERRREREEQEGVSEDPPDDGGVRMRFEGDELVTYDAGERVRPTGAPPRATLERRDPDHAPPTPRTPPKAPPVVAVVLSPPPPSPVAMGRRVRVLTGPVDSYGRAATMDGRVTDWDGVCLAILFDGFDVGPRFIGPSGPRRYLPYRVSELDVWGNPVHPERVTWLRGDEVPLVAPDPPAATPVVTDPDEGAPEAPAPSPPPPSRDSGFATAHTVPLPRQKPPYPGMLG